MLNYFRGDSTIQREVSNVAEMDYVRILRDLREDADKTQTQIEAEAQQYVLGRSSKKK